MFMSLQYVVYTPLTNGSIIHKIATAFLPRNIRGKCLNSFPFHIHFNNTTSNNFKQCCWLIKFPETKISDAFVNIYIERKVSNWKNWRYVNISFKEHFLITLFYYKIIKFKFTLKTILIRLLCKIGISLSPNFFFWKTKSYLYGNIGKN